MQNYGCSFSPTEVGVSFSVKVGKFIVLGWGGGGQRRQSLSPSTITKEG